MKIIVPLAGKDLRFEKIGVYKPLISINNKPLIHHVLNVKGYPLGTLYFIVLKEHEEKYNVTRKLKNYFGNRTYIYIINKETEGSPDTILQIKDILNDDEDILIELGDVVRDLSRFKKDINKKNNYAGIVPIDSEFTSKIWGYVTIKNNNATHLYEKSLKKMQGGATMGLYYFSRGNEFVTYAKEMINKKIKIPPLQLYYVGPVYNEYVINNKKIGISKTKIIDVLGSPEQIDAYLKKVPYNN